MSDEVEDLIKDLGLEEQDVDNDEPEESVVVHVDKAAQIAASDDLIAKCKEIYQVGRENDLAWRWMIGQEVNNAYEDETKYEEGVLKRTSNELDIAISDLSRFRKFYLSFDKEKVIDRAQVGYTWSHFKVINDLPDGDIKKRMISQIESEDEAPKVKDLQDAIDEEKNAQLAGLDESSGGLGGSTGEASTSSGPSPIKPVNAALRTIEKLNDYLTDILIQEEAGIDFDNDSKEEKYNEAIDELSTKLKELNEISDKIWESGSEEEKESEDLETSD